MSVSEVEMDALRKRSSSRETLPSSSPNDVQSSAMSGSTRIKFLGIVLSVFLSLFAIGWRSGTMNGPSCEQLVNTMNGPSCEQLVNTVVDSYGSILGRAPDPEGLKTYVRALSENELTAATFQAILKSSDEAATTATKSSTTRPVSSALDEQTAEKTLGPAMYLVDTITEPSFRMLCLEPEEDRVVSGEVVHAQFYTADVSNLLYSLFQEADPSAKSNSLVVDAGANIGYYTLFSLASGFEVIAFEPQQRACRLLRMSATANDFQRLTLVNAALAGKSGEKVRTSYIHGNWGESSSFQDSENCNDQVWREGCVTTTTVDTHVHKPVFFLKIDVEGHETDVFEGATKMLADFRPRHILMEYRPEQITLAKQILSYGYVAESQHLLHETNKTCCDNNIVVCVTISRPTPTPDDEHVRPAHLYPCTHGVRLCAQHPACKFSL